MAHGAETTCKTLENVGRSVRRRVIRSRIQEMKRHREIEMDQILADVATKYRIALPPKARSSAIYMPSKEALEQLLESLSQEILETGIGGDGELNDRGQHLDDLISEVGKWFAPME